MPGFRAVYPRIDLRLNLDHRKRSPDDPSSVLGNAAALGYSLQFCGPALAVAPDEVVCAVIAHEIAHVGQWICGDLDYPLEGWFEELNQSQIEALDWDTEYYAEEWATMLGFDTEAVDEWLKDPKTRRLWRAEEKRREREIETRVGFVWS